MKVSLVLLFAVFTLLYLHFFLEIPHPVLAGGDDLSDFDPNKGPYKGRNHTLFIKWATLKTQNDRLEALLIEEERESDVKELVKDLLEKVVEKIGE